MSNAAIVERVVQASPERVWSAMATPAIASWFWPPSFEATATVDAQVPGGIAVRSERMGMGFTGALTAVEPPRRLAWTWRWDGETLVTRVGIELAATASGTAITVRHEGFPDRATADEHAVGWGDCLDRLPAFLADGGD